MKVAIWTLLMIGIGMSLEYEIMHRPPPPPQCVLDTYDGSCTCTVSEQVWLNSIHPELQLVPSLQSNH